MEFLVLITFFVGCILAVYGLWWMVSVSFEGNGGWQKFVYGIACLAICPGFGATCDTAFCGDGGAWVMEGPE